jgi:hypothetical protein
MDEVKTRKGISIDAENASIILERAKQRRDVHYISEMMAVSKNAIHSNNPARLDGAVRADEKRSQCQFSNLPVRKRLQNRKSSPENHQSRIG